MAERRPVTETVATRYVRADEHGKGKILDELCATMCRHRSHAREALQAALRPKVAAPRRPRPPKYGPKVIAALTFCWSALGMPAGKRLATMLGELVAVLRRFGELVIDEDTAALLVSMSVATIDRRLAGERRERKLKGRATIKPDSKRALRNWTCSLHPYATVDSACATRYTLYHWYGVYHARRYQVRPRHGRCQRR